MSLADANRALGDLLDRGLQLQAVGRGDVFIGNAEQDAHLDAPQIAERLDGQIVWSVSWLDADDFRASKLHGTTTVAEFLGAREARLFQDDDEDAPARLTSVRGAVSLGDILRALNVPPALRDH